MFPGVGERPPPPDLLGLRRVRLPAPHESQRTMTGGPHLDRVEACLAEHRLSEDPDSDWVASVPDSRRIRKRAVRPP